MVSSSEKTRGLRTFSESPKTTPVPSVTNVPIIEVYHRTSSRWTYDTYGPGDEIELTSLNIRLPLAALYR